MPVKQNGHRSSAKNSKSPKYHKILFETQKKLGINRVEFAKYLGIGYMVLSKIMWSQYIPNFHTKKGKELKCSLENVTGLFIEEIFPDHVFSNTILNKDHEIQVTFEVPEHLLPNIEGIHWLPCPPDEAMMQKEERGHDIKECLNSILLSLDEQHRTTLRLRFFNELKHEDCIPLIPGVTTRQGIQQLETKALKILRAKVSMENIRVYAKSPKTHLEVRSRLVEISAS